MLRLLAVATLISWLAAAYFAAKHGVRAEHMLPIADSQLEQLPTEVVGFGSELTGSESVVGGWRLRGQGVDCGQRNAAGPAYDITGVISQHCSACSSSTSQAWDGSGDQLSGLPLGRPACWPWLRPDIQGAAGEAGDYDDDDGGEAAMHGRRARPLPEETAPQACMRCGHASCSLDRRPCVLDQRLAVRLMPGGRYLLSVSVGADPPRPKNFFPHDKYATAAGLPAAAAVAGAAAGLAELEVLVGVGAVGSAGTSRGTADQPVLLNISGITLT